MRDLPRSEKAALFGGLAMVAVAAVLGACLVKLALDAALDGLPDPGELPVLEVWP